MAGCGAATQEESRVVPDNGAGARPPITLAPVAEGARAPQPRLVADSGDGVVSLRTPVSRGQAIAVVVRFFDAVTSESNTRLAELFRDDATIRYDTTPALSQALMAWVRRFGQMDYRALRAATLYREADIEVYSSQDVPALAHQRPFALTPVDDQLLVRFPVSASAASNQARFGHEMQFLLDPTEDGLFISAIFEDGYVAP